MFSRTLNRAAAAVGISMLVVTAGGGATAVAQTTVQPQAVQGGVVRGGADGSPRTLMCPPEENVLSGGFTLSAPEGRRLGAVPADLVESHPTVDATGWVIAVRKGLAPDGRDRHADHGDPADLTIWLVCTQGENTPGG